MVLIPKYKYEAALQKKSCNENSDDVEEKTHKNDEGTLNKNENENNLKTVTKDINENNIENLLVISIPKKYTEKAVRFLNYLQEQTSISWNQQGEVRIEGTVISNSNIIDWIRDIVIPNNKRKSPKGIDMFYKFLKGINIPMSMISSQKRKAVFHSDSSDNEISEDDSCDHVSNDTKNTNKVTDKKLYVKRDLESLFPPKKKIKWLHFKL